jgi:GNAT superfamily N-acetyltransferase
VQHTSGVTGRAYKRISGHVDTPSSHLFVGRTADRAGDSCGTTHDRRAGHGEALLAHIESWAREQECEYVALALVEGDDAAGSFYREQEIERWAT